MKRQICTCVNVDYEALGLEDVNGLMDLNDNAEEISRKEFLKNCDVEDFLLRDFKDYPHDFQFKRNGNIYFFVHSMIEHYYV